jgi:hypothetical protein
MDINRKRAEAYEYLCHLEEIRVWTAKCIKEELPPPTELEESLRNGVYLAKVAHVFNPELVPEKCIFDKSQTRYRSFGLNFRHTENINHWAKVR